MTRKQILEFGPIRMEKDDEAEVLYFLSGKRMYEIGAMSGRYPPLGWRRPGFLVGKPLAEVGPEERPEEPAHLLYEMGGIWAHPVKSLERITFSVQENDREPWVLESSQAFVNHLAWAEFVFEREGLSIRRRDFVHEDEPALFIQLVVENNRGRAVRGRLLVEVEPNLIPSWFSGLPNSTDDVEVLGGRVVAEDHARGRNDWVVVVGSDRAPLRTGVRRGESGRSVATLTFHLALEAGQKTALTVLVVAEQQRGRSAALDRFDRLIRRGDEVRALKERYYADLVFGGVRFDCPDRRAVDAFYLAKANFVLLTADLPALGRYLFAGLPEYVQLFGTDTLYSIPGLLAVGQRDVARDALAALGRYAQQLAGRVPHEVTTNGRVFHPGNTQETPQFAIACWEYFRGTGERAFLEEVFPLCYEGVTRYVLAHWDDDLDYYPGGNGMVERLGMGPEKLDAVCYFARALAILADMAGALGYAAQREDLQTLAAALYTAINADFWIDEERMWADSLAEDHTKKLDGYWTVAVPMETGVADPDKGLKALERIEREWVNEYGMVHTREREPLVWTLPTGVLATAEYRYGRGEMGWRLTANIAETMYTGMLGAFKELIPEGLCFMQLWSPALYLQGVVQGLFGVQPTAHESRLDVLPQVPAAWSFARIEDLPVGGHLVNLHYGRDAVDRLVVEHAEGDRPLTCRLGVFVDEAPAVRVPPEVRARQATERRGVRTVLWLEVEVAPGQRAEIEVRPGEVALSVPVRTGRQG